MKNILVVILAFGAVLILAISDFGRSRGVVYDCRDAHWHPDVPVDVKKECAKLFREEWERRQQEEQTKKLLISI